MNSLYSSKEMQEVQFHVPNVQDLVNKTRVGVYINAYNERENIANVVDSVLNQNIGENYELEEIIIVVDGSTDGTDIIAKRIAADDPLIEAWIFPKNLGKVECFNRLVQHSKTSGIGIAVFPMADVLLGRDALISLLRVFEDSSVGGSCGRVIVANNEKELTGKLAHAIWDIHDVVLSAFPKLNGEFYAVRPNLLTTVPSYIPCEDIYIEVPLIRGGYRISYVRNATVFARGPCSLNELVKQRVRCNLNSRVLNCFENYRIPTNNLRNLIVAFIKTIATNGWSSVMSLITCAFVENWAKLVSFVQYKKGKNPRKWERLGTTKCLINKEQLEAQARVEKRKLSLAP
jgi:cellulose synthase/poly-beta-1,6-N-acetylglucosamine synthase-like glycosyltransferase